ncbi:MAG TPA: peptidase S8, partial [Pricia sp.]|nr:peptidase S8 [Pricia sp.]
MTAKKKKVESPNVPKVIFAQVSPKSIGGQSLFESGVLATSQNIQNYLSEKEVTLKAVEVLKKAGFRVLQITNTTINISGSASVYKDAFGQEIIAEERESFKSGGEKEMVTYLDTVQTDITGLIVPKSGNMANFIEGVAIETPYYTFAPNHLPPTKDYWHLNVPGDVSVGCNADRAHRASITGKGVHVAMVDTGFYKHPFFEERGYSVNTVRLAPGTLNPLTDDNGHGTGESANIFATAPDCRLTPVKWNFVNSTAAFNSAVALNPDIITCSWGSHRPNSISAAEQTLAAAISLAVAKGIVVVFSAGNGHWGFPGQHPDVISAGGVYLGDNMSLRASNYASGFDSNIYLGRQVPDVCGLVGQNPGAKYIMLPVQGGCEIDTDGAGGSHPSKDETAANDGWAVFSGTSAAAPQLAGVAALIKQA